MLIVFCRRVVKGGQRGTNEKERDRPQASTPPPQQQQPSQASSPVSGPELKSPTGGSPKGSERFRVKEGGVKKVGRPGSSPRSQPEYTEDGNPLTSPIRISSARKSYGHGRQSSTTSQQSPGLGRLTQSAPSVSLLGQSPRSSRDYKQQGSILRKHKSDIVSPASRINQSDLTKQARLAPTNDDGSGRQKKRKAMHAAGSDQITGLLKSHSIGSALTSQTNQAMGKSDLSKSSPNLASQNSPPGNKAQVQTSPRATSVSSNSASLGYASSEVSSAPRSPISSASSTSSEEDKRGIPRTKKSFKDLWALDS